MNRKEMQHELAKAQLELNQITKTSETAHQALAEARERVESSTQRVASAKAAFGLALVKDELVSESRQELDGARRALEQATEDLTAIEDVINQCDSRASERKISDVQNRINSLRGQILESVVQEELGRLDSSAMEILTRAWAIDSHQSDTTGFGSWLAARFARFVIQPEQKSKLVATMQADYKI